MLQMTKQFTDFYEAHRFLEEHHAFENKKFGDVEFHESLDIAVVKVNPETNEVDDDDSKNTKVQIWLEAGEWYEEEGYAGFCHNTDLDTGGDTFEEAIINMANLVLKHFGENPEGYGEPTEEELAQAKALFDEIAGRNKNA